MEETCTFSAGEEWAGIRLDQALPMCLEGVSRSQVQKWIGEERVCVNGRPASKKTILSNGDSIEVRIPKPEDFSVEPEDIPVEIVYEDEDLLVVNKPRGMVVHPAPGNYTHTLVNAMLFHTKGNLSRVGAAGRPGIVHRIDKDTSGLLLVAKNDYSHHLLAEQISAHDFLRIYQTVVHGKMKETSGTITAPIGRSHKDRKKMAVVAGGRTAITHYTLLKQKQLYAHLSVRLETGRTHQIRVHMQSIHHPIAGDPVYGVQRMSKSEEALCGQWLHAQTLGFIHPKTKKYMEFSKEPPKELLTFWESK